MKREFALLLINSAAAEDGVSPELRKDAALKIVAGPLKLRIYTEKDIVEPAPNADTVVEGVHFIDELPANVVLLIGGCPSASQLKEVCQTLAKHDLDFIIVTDALAHFADLRPTLVELNEGVFVDVDGTKTNYGPAQLTVTCAVRTLVRARRPMLYAYPKADNTTTTVVLIDSDTPTPKVLSIVRAHEPFAGCESLPGGFLNVHLEDLPTCSGRELLEECHLNPQPEELVLIDVRSGIERDIRGHVVDHGYAWFVPAAKKEAVLAAVQAGDDATPGSARFVDVQDVLQRKLAFDHHDLLVAAMSHLELLARASKNAEVASAAK